MVGGISFSNEQAYKKQARLQAIGIDFIDYWDAEAYFDYWKIRDFWKREGNKEAEARLQRHMNSLLEGNEYKILNSDKYVDPDGYCDAASYAADRWPNYVD